MEIESLFGLPAHPLLVHTVVVLVPLITLGIVAAAVWAPARRALAPTLLGASVVTAILVPFVTGSGEELQGQVERSNLVHEHAEQGEGFLLLAIVLVIAAALVFARWWFERHDESAPTWMRGRRNEIAIALVAIVLAIVPTIRVIQIGHSGAEATWEDVGARD